MSGASGSAGGVALRMDDVGAASKRWEIYARPLPLPGRAAHLGDLLFLKFVPPFGAWGPYRELRPEEWERIFEALRSRDAVLTVAVTAAWITWSGDLIPFPERFPRQADLLRQAVAAGLIEVANHGLTHCVLEGGAFRPKAFSGNRRAHREFWDWIPAEVQAEHLRRSQAILAQWLGADVSTFVPPGNVFGHGTLAAAARYGLRYVSCATSPRVESGIAIVGDQGVIAFHDRDIVRNGITWFSRLLDRTRALHPGICFVRDLGAAIASAARHDAGAVGPGLG